MDSARSFAIRMGNSNTAIGYQEMMKILKDYDFECRRVTMDSLVKAIEETGFLTQPSQLMNTLQRAQQIIGDKGYPHSIMLQAIYDDLESSDCCQKLTGDPVLKAIHFGSVSENSPDQSVVGIYIIAKKTGNNDNVKPVYLGRGQIRKRFSAHFRYAQTPNLIPFSGNDNQKIGQYLKGLSQAKLSKIVVGWFQTKNHKCLEGPLLEILTQAHEDMLNQKKGDSCKKDINKEKS